MEISGLSLMCHLGATRIIYIYIEARNGAEDLVDPITECGNCKTITS